MARKPFVMTLSEQEQAEFEERKSSKSKPFLTPGQYEAVIKSIEVSSHPAKDPTWLNLRIVYKLSNDLETSDFILIPQESANFEGEPKPGITYYSFVRWCESLGVELDKKNIEATLKKYFDDGAFAKLADEKNPTHVCVKLGYRKTDHYAHWLGKVDGKSTYEIRNGAGEVVKDEAGQPLIFDDVDALQVFCHTNSLRYQKFLRVLSYKKSETPNTFSQFTTPIKPKFTMSAVKK